MVGACADRFVHAFDAVTTLAGVPPRACLPPRATGNRAKNIDDALQKM